MAPRPTEVRAVVGLLEGPAADVEELAKRVIEAMDEARTDRASFVVVVAHQGKLVRSYGPYATQKQAEKALGSLPVIAGEAYGICKQWSHRHAEKALEAADMPVHLTRKNTDRGPHPVPYPAEDRKSRKRYERMSNRQRSEEYDARMP